MSLDNPYQRAADLAEASKLEAAWKIIGKMLIDNPHDVQALITGSYIMRRLGMYPAAYHFALSAKNLWPHDSAAWTNLGHAASEMWLVAESEAHYLKALSVCTREDHRKTLWLNLSALYIDNGRFEEAQALTAKILALEPDHKNAQANLGFCQLAQRNWDGWKGYRNTIGSDWRPRIQYGEEPEWDGSPGKTVVLYEDQGLGDAISFASMLPDAIDICKKVIVDCDRRLAGLFRRSFPKAKVYGTRRAKDGQWDKEDWMIGASLPLGQIGEYFRQNDSQFPGTPYLIPCPDRVTMWKGLFATQGRPVIGIAWSGGIPKTNSRNRKIALEDFASLFKVAAHFVSLEYRDASDAIRGTPVVQYSWGTLTDDYDDTAALIASLDYVICVQTAVAHTAGALGVPVSVLVPEATQWRYGKSQDSIPWYKSLNIVRQQKTGSWKDEIERATQRACAHLGLLPGPATAASRINDVRHGVDRLRALGESGHRANGRDTSA